MGKEETQNTKKKKIDAEKLRISPNQCLEEEEEEEDGCKDKICRMQKGAERGRRRLRVSMMRFRNAI